MATVNFRVNDDLKEKSFSILKDNEISPTEFFTSVLEYIASTGKLPVKHVALSLEDQELLNLARKRMNDSRENFEEISLDDL